MKVRHGMPFAIALMTVALFQFLFNNTCQAFSAAEIESAVTEMFDATAPPAMLLNAEGLTQDAKDGGSCSGIFDVVVEDRLGESLSTPCRKGRWTLHGAPSQQVSGISQITNAASIAVRDFSDATSLLPGRTLDIAPQDLARIIPTLKPGDHVNLSAGLLNNADIPFPASSGTPEGPPIVIDAGHRVTITGQTRFHIAAKNISLTNFIFADVDDEAITVTNSGFSLTHSQFDKCGDPLKPKSQCIMLTGDAAKADISFNEFVGSQSMTLKVRENADGSGQPVDVRIRYNVFRDIERLSDNGQEPIQIAGQNGGESSVDFATHIEHNIFYRTNGDRETISLKGTGVTTRWNVFYDMDAAPNFRGSGANEFSGNVMMRTRPLRVAGDRNRVEHNFMACPLQPFAILLSHGTKGYRAATNSLISDNTIVARSAIRFAGQEQPVTQPATGNLIENNSFFIQPDNAAILDFPQDNATSVGNTVNILGQRLCERTFKTQ